MEDFISTNKTQKLRSGLVIRQDIRSCVRFVMFETVVEGWEYATHGGTLFLVCFRNRVFGITCKHVLGDFEWSQLCVTDRKHGDRIAGLKAVFSGSGATGDAVDTDILDIAVIEFSSDVSADFFTDDPYLIDPETYSTAHNQDRVLVYGALKDHSEIGDSTIAPKFGLFRLLDNGPSETDCTLRKASDRFETLECQSVTGLSGSPVYSENQNALAGVVVRGGIGEKNRVSVWYVDIIDVVKMLEAILDGTMKASYRKLGH